MLMTTCECCREALCTLYHITKRCPWHEASDRMASISNTSKNSNPMEEVVRGPKNQLHEPEKGSGSVDRSIQCFIVRRTRIHPQPAASTARQLVWLYNPRIRKELYSNLQKRCERPYSILKKVNDVIFWICRQGSQAEPKIVHIDRLDSMKVRTLQCVWENRLGEGQCYALAASPAASAMCGAYTFTLAAGVAEYSRRHHLAILVEQLVQVSLFEVERQVGDVERDGVRVWFWTTNPFWKPHPRVVDGQLEETQRSVYTALNSAGQRSTRHDSCLFGFGLGSTHHPGLRQLLNLLQPRQNCISQPNPVGISSCRLPAGEAPPRSSLPTVVPCTHQDCSEPSSNSHSHPPGQGHPVWNRQPLVWGLPDNLQPQPTPGYHQHHRWHHVLEPAAAAIRSHCSCVSNYPGPPSRWVNCGTVPPHPPGHDSQNHKNIYITTTCIDNSFSCVAYPSSIWCSDQEDRTGSVLTRASTSKASTSGSLAMIFLGSNSLPTFSRNNFAGSAPTNDESLRNHFCPVAAMGSLRLRVHEIPTFAICAWMPLACRAFTAASADTGLSKSTKPYPHEPNSNHISTDADVPTKQRDPGGNMDLATVFVTSASTKPQNSRVDTRVAGFPPGSFVSRGNGPATPTSAKTQHDAECSSTTFPDFAGFHKKTQCLYLSSPSCPETLHTPWFYWPPDISLDDSVLHCVIIEMDDETLPVDIFGKKRGVSITDFLRDNISNNEGEPGMGISYMDTTPLSQVSENL
ncbi:hypothetical protein PR048_019224 [Dryococelus australis]|uniref:Uncharacterized protein n=1 Tax=Dryococelus australis TaxID=614101 RepID=A0ABQ9H2W1_9NEOP|nr:hypothetical protein PR048_019224 [Dryococelus australis]